VPFYTSGDAELHYVVLGSPVRELGAAGHDVLLLHPTPVHHGFWIPAAERLLPQHRVVLPDLRGHGKSQSGEGPYSISRLADDIERLLDLLAIERAFFAGCSIGGLALFELWRRAPHRIAALAFCCSKPQPDTPANKQRREGWIAEVRAHGAELFFEAMAETLIGPTTKLRDSDKVLEALAMMQCVTPDTVIAIQRGASARPDFLPIASTIRVPVCVIAAGEDQSSTPAEMKQLAEAARNGGYGAEYHLIPDAGHYAPWEQPEVVGPLLAHFFESVGEPARERTAC
jgi:3-oxoadipate enol-lactonase